MHPAKQLLSRLYLGDRGVTHLHFDAAQCTVSLGIDQIAVMPLGAKQWNFDSEREIENGEIRFEGVESISFAVDGAMPNDFVEIDVVDEVDEGKKVRVSIVLGAVGTDLLTKESRLSLTCVNARLIDPQIPSE